MMNLKVAVRYRLYDNKRAMIIFYIIILSVFIFSLILANVIRDTHSGRLLLGGFDTASMIFLFVLGMNSFKEVFKMFIQNGLSRKTMFLSQVLFVALICPVMAVADRLLAIIGGLLSTLSNQFFTTGLFEEMFEQHAVVRFSLVSLLFNISMYILAAMVGFFITTLYYRMNKIQKIMLSVGVPVLLFTVLPVLDTIFLEGMITRIISTIVVFAFSNPWMSMLTGVVLAMIFGGLSWLLVKRAVARD